MGPFFPGGNTQIPIEIVVRFVKRNAPLLHCGWNTKARNEIYRSSVTNRRSERNLLFAIGYRFVYNVRSMPTFMPSTKRYKGKEYSDERGS